MNKDNVDKALRWMAHNRYTVLAVAVVLALSGVSCAALSVRKPAPPFLAENWETAPTPLVSPPQQVNTDEYDRLLIITRGQFDAEATILSNKVSRLAGIAGTLEKVVERDERAYQDRVAFIQDIYNKMAALATIGAQNSGIPGAGTGLAALLGIGGLLIGGSRHMDAKRKDVVINDLKEQISSTTQLTK